MTESVTYTFMVETPVGCGSCDYRRDPPDLLITSACSSFPQWLPIEGHAHNSLRGTQPFFLAVVVSANQRNVDRVVLGCVVAFALSTVDYKVIVGRHVFNHVNPSTK
eukprot:COSAG02_NODE_6086_length_3813_cov_3.395261_2_plen_107_part_00